MNEPINFPKWKHSLHPDSKQVRSTLVATAELEMEIGPTWVDDPLSLGVDAVPYPCELTPAGTLVHYGTCADANGNHAYGPRPTVTGINGATIIS